MRKELIIVIFLCAVSLLFVTVIGCSKPEIKIKPTLQELLTDECEAACQEALQQGQNLSNGPCLLDPIRDTEWVCDIAHEPREIIDNLRENQCNSWHNGTAKHFIELTPECKFIKAV
ncbi:MAG: hypothetical protein ACPLXC_03565 [Candidatus Pacearchaeota archaeon]